MSIKKHKNKLKASRNEDLKKITVIAWDITRKNLGLPDDFLKCLEDEVSAVFYLAAAYELPLKDAMRITITGMECRCTVSSNEELADEFPWAFLLITPSVLLCTIVTFVLQIIPAYLIDLWCIITGKKATQMKVQMRLKKLIDVLKFFLLNEWKFSDVNMRNLLTSICSEDRETFNFDVKTINWETCIEGYVLGARKYLLKSD